MNETINLFSAPICIQDKVGDKMYTSNVLNGETADYVFDKQKAFLRKKKFIWRAYLLAYSNESAKLYSNIEEKWNELDAITGKYLAFVFSNECASRMFHVGNEIQRERYLPDGIKYSIGESNSALIERFSEIYDVQRLQLPCLIIENLISDNLKPIILKLKNDSDLCIVMKYISILSSDYLRQIEEIQNRIVYERLRQVEYYNDMKKRIIKLSVDNGKSYEEVVQLFRDFENCDTSYSKRRLEDLWSYVISSTGRKVFGDKNGSLIYKLFVAREEIDNFNTKLSKFESLIAETDSLLLELYNSIRDIDLTNISKTVQKYTQKQIKQIDDILIKNGVDDWFRNDIVSDLNKCHRDYSDKKINSIIDRIRNSKGMVAIDDCGRVITIITMMKELWNLYGVITGLLL